MKKLILIIILALIAFCAYVVIFKQEEITIYQLESLCDNLETNYEDLTEEQWDDAVDEYEELLIKIESYKLSDDQQKKIAKLKGKCAGYFTKSSFDSVNEKLKEISNEVEGVIEGFIDAFNDSKDN